jgi:hypothetical protein
LVELADILRRYWPAYQAKFGGQILYSHSRAVEAILSCRTSELGGQLYGCDCGYFHFAYHSCHHRACPKCGHTDATQWLERQKTKLLPVPYFLVTFTVPEDLRMVIRSNQQVGYNLLFKQSAKALQEVASRPKYLGAELGFMGVLQTWTRQMVFHPHVHYVVPGGGLTPDGLRWVRTKSPDYFMPEKPLAARFRTRMKVAMAAQPELWAQIPEDVWHQRWVVDIEPVGQGQSALKYLSAYVYKTAITSQRILSDDGQSITFAYKQSQTGQWKTMTLDAEEFIRRFLQHVLLLGFQRVRYYGWLAPASKNRWHQVLFWLNWRPPALQPPIPLPPPICPRCQRPMELLTTLPRGPPQPTPRIIVLSAPQSIQPPTSQAVQTV